MVITLSNIIRQTINEIEQTHSHWQLIDIFNNLLENIEDHFDYTSQEYRLIKKLIRMVHFNRHSHRQDYYQLKAEIIVILSQHIS